MTERLERQRPTSRATAPPPLLWRVTGLPQHLWLQGFRLQPSRGAHKVWMSRASPQATHTTSQSAHWMQRPIWVHSPIRPPLSPRLSLLLHPLSLMTLMAAGLLQTEPGRLTLRPDHSEAAST